MSKNIVAYSCDYIEIKNGVPVCTHPDKPRGFFCDPYQLACDSATFEKIWNQHPTGREISSERCVVCRHNCQQQVRDGINVGMRCGDHPLSFGCKYADRCKARVVATGVISHFCLVKGKQVNWFDSCDLFEKRGDRDE